MVTVTCPSLAREVPIVRSARVHAWVGRVQTRHTSCGGPFVSVDEAGTEAAAASEVVVRPSSAGNQVIADRPLLVVIRDWLTGAKREVDNRRW